MLVAVSTAGASPVLARRLRERLEAALPTRLGEFALWLRELRQTGMERLRDTRERRRFFEELIDGDYGLVGHVGEHERIGVVGHISEPRRGAGFESPAVQRPADTAFHRVR